MVDNPHTIRRKILFVGTLNRGSASPHRIQALTRLGYEVVPFDIADYLGGLSRAANWIYHRLMVGTSIDRLNRDLIKVAESTRPDFIFVDKGLFLKPRTVERLSKSVAPTIHNVTDNPFGPRHDPGWRLFLKALPLYDVHLVPRQVSVQDFRTAGARQIFLFPPAFELSVHYPAPGGYGEKDRVIDVSFTGTPYDNRAEFFTELVEKHGIAVDIRGSLWERVLSPKVAAKLLKGGPVYEDDYRHRFWESKICLSFVTHSNLDEVGQKSFEITGAGSFMLAESTQGHLAAFEAGKEAVFFSSAADCARLIREYLPDPTLRERIAGAGYRRSIESGYSNDARLKLVFDKLSVNPPITRP